MPLVFFGQATNTTRAAGFRTQADAEHPWATTGTQDLLLYRDILESVVNAAYRGKELVADADELLNGGCGTCAGEEKFVDAKGATLSSTMKATAVPAPASMSSGCRPEDEGTRVLPRPAWRRARATATTAIPGACSTRSMSVTTRPQRGTEGVVSGIGITHHSPRLWHYLLPLAPPLLALVA